jgi:AcrR family transcriptional regulator
MIQAAHHRPGTHPRGEDTRRRILEAAIQVFATEGYEGASTRKLAERAAANLPAIQYYFGSKEGLYRAVIEHIAQLIEMRMVPVAERVRMALASGDPSSEELLALLYEMLDAFVAAVFEKAERESRRLFFARAEIENTTALDPIHDSCQQQIAAPCAALIGRLLDRPADQEHVVLRTLAILGQVVVFCNKGARRALGWSDVGEDHVPAIQAMIREHTEAILGGITTARRERRAGTYPPATAPDPALSTR